MNHRSLKQTIKFILGDNAIQFIKKIRGEFQYFITAIIFNKDRMIFYPSEWDKPITLEKKDKHLFFGYYDIQQINRDKTKALVTEVDKNADTKRDAATLEWYDLNNGTYHEIAKTSAWCWQQGSRLRWHPVEDNTVIYNDIEGDHYITIFYNILLKKQMNILPMALYDITPNGRYGFSLNFSRLQRLRPGYGYNSLPDKTSDEKIPENDGIFRIDCETKETLLIISYKELAKITPESNGKWVYINHISVSPNGKKIMFFYIWTDSPMSIWKVKLFISDIDGSNLKCLEENLIASHYAWRNDKELLIVTAARNKENSHYYLYNIDNGEKNILLSEDLKNNGHPSFFNDGLTFVSDTYPLKGIYQKLFTMNIFEERACSICDLYADPRLFDEKRCDLHPRITDDGTIITVDSTYKNGERSILIFNKNQ